MMKKNGFTLIELLIVVAIILTLAGILLPAISSAVERSKAAKMIATVNTLESACEMYFFDTGRFGYEYAAPWYVRASEHHFSMDPGVPGWKGPYIKTPLSRSDNPFGAPVWVYADTRGWHTQAGGNGFDLNYDGTPETLGWSGNSVVFYNIPPSVARMADDAKDGGVVGTVATTNPDGTTVTTSIPWEQAGKVEYFHNYFLTFFLMRPR